MSNKIKHLEQEINKNVGIESTPTKKNILGTKDKDKIPIGVRWMAGLLGSTISSFICSPLDLIKVRLQVSYEKDKKSYKNLFHAINTIYKEEKFRGFWVGAKIAVVTVPIFYSFYFPIYELSKEMYSKILYNEPKKFNSVVFTLSSATAAISCDLITNPMWVIRLRYQTEYLHSGQNKIDSFNIIKSVHKLYKKEGFFALYRGLGASMLGIPHVIIQFNLYEHLKQKGAEKYLKNINDLPLHYILFISVFSKMSASFCTYPHEVIRNNLQNIRNFHENKMSIIKLVKEIHREKGISGFYAGFKINLLRILPNNAIMFVAYEYLSKFIAIQYHLVADKFTNI